MNTKNVLGTNYKLVSINAKQTSLLLICRETKDVAVIDPGFDGDHLIEYIVENELNPKMILLTHGHYDHIASAEQLKSKFTIPIYVHEEDEEYLKNEDINYSKIFLDEKIRIEADEIYTDSDVIELGSLKLNVIHTPGHTKGSSCFYIEDEKQPLLISGDTLFFETVGRTDLYGGDYTKIVESIRTKLLILPDETKVIPGHGHITSIEHEKTQF